MKIKTIKENTDFNTLEMSYYNWDVVMFDKKYDIYSINGYVHSIGGKYGNNQLWAFPINEKPSYKNAFAFNGEPCDFDFEIKNKKTCRHRSVSEISDCVEYVIRRNGRRFYSKTVNNVDYAINETRKLLYRIQSHPVGFNFRNYEKEIINRKIFWREQPAIIVSYKEGGNLKIIPEGKERFDTPCYDKQDELNFMEYDSENNCFYIMEDLFAPSIYWFRD